MKKAHNLVALFGGTFDPIHFGHLNCMANLAQQIGLSHIDFLPNHVPPHRQQPIATAQQRLEMIQLAIGENSLFAVDDRELRRNDISYTIDTLKAIRHERDNNDILIFIIGMDSLISLPTWHKWQLLRNYCHLVVCARPGYTYSSDMPELTSWLKLHQIYSLQPLKQQSSGFVYFADTPLISISATTIRHLVQNKQPIDNLLPEAVINYINHHGLYR